jgi:pyruvate/2-oxoacid:ferredoxin oxidoreductase beta subunit
LLKHTWTRRCCRISFAQGGHGAISNALNAALVKPQVDPRKVVIVTDIGCSGLADKYFVTNAFHGLHGRSVTYATGLKLANPDLKVIVLMGDGGCGIGGHHLINAARRNIGVTVLVFNNLNYGMTGGEHSVSTPPGGITSSTPGGQLEQPMDICGTVAVNGATFVARTTSFDKSLPDLMAAAIQNEGFSLVDIWELCTAYYVPNNRFSKGALENAMQVLKFPTGVLCQSARPEYSRAYREATAAERGEPALPVRPVQAKYASSLQRRHPVCWLGRRARRSIWRRRCSAGGGAGRAVGHSATITR